MLWRSDAYIGVLEQYEHEITCMTKCFEGLAICTWSGQVNLWDVHLTKCTKRIELGNLPFKMVNFNITSIDYNQKRLLILTDSGDAIEISLNEQGSDGGLPKEAIRSSTIAEYQRNRTVSDQH